jgi:hypothetical protein
MKYYENRRAFISFGSGFTNGRLKYMMNTGIVVITR